MARCTECSKFVAVELQEPEIEVDLSDGTLAISARLELTCGECAEPLYESTLEGECDISEFTDQHADEASGEHALEVAEALSAPTDGWREGKRTYGCSAKVRVVCSCGAEHTADWYEDILLADMEQL